MGYKEEILDNGNILRTYFAHDDSKFYEFYHNGKKILFPIKEMQLGNNQRINFMIDFKKLDLNFSLVNIKIRFKANKPKIKEDIFLTKENSLISTNSHNVIGKFEKPEQYVYVIDLTKYFYMNITKKAFFGIYTEKNIIFHSIYSSYNLMPEVIIEYIPKYKIENFQKIEINKNNNFFININNGLLIAEEVLLKEPINLNVNLETFKFNYSQYVYGGIKNYKYVDELGLEHIFKLEKNSIYEYQDINNPKIKLFSNNDHTYTIYKDDLKLIFNRKGYLEKIIYQDLLEELIFYDDSNRISLIKSKNGEIIYFKYLKNLTLIISDKYNVGIFKEKNNIKIINSKGEITNYYYRRKLEKLKKNNTLISFKYDSTNRITLISKQTKDKINYINFKYQYLKTEINGKIYFYDSFGKFFKQEGRCKCKKQ